MYVCLVAVVLIGGKGVRVSTPFIMNIFKLMICFTLCFTIWGDRGVRLMGGVGFRNKGSRRRGLTLYLGKF